MKQYSRRHVLRVGAGAAGVAALTACVPAAPAAPPAPAPGPAPTPPPPVSARSLVIVEMDGGHDGYSMAIPYTDANYYGLRPNVAHAANEVLHLPTSTTLGLHPNLTQLSQRPLALVQGLGMTNPDYSHFEMMRRWWFGDVTGNAYPGFGFLGRVCDVIATPNDAATGVSLGWGPTPALSAQNAVTISMDPYSSGAFPGPGSTLLRNLWFAAQRAMSQEDRLEATMMFAARQGTRNALRFSDLLTTTPASTVTYPNTTLGQQLKAAVKLIHAGAGVRIVHIPFGGSFDSHENHRSEHDDIMTTFNGAMSAFLQELDTVGLSRNVLLATTSEFGRHAKQNEDGLDHGSASVGLLAGAINQGVYGPAVGWSQAQRDGSGNLKATVTMGQYYATLAQWLGVSSGSVLAGAPAPIAGLTI